MLHPGLRVVRGIVFDLDGVLYEDQHVVRGGPEAVAAIAGAGIAVRFLTNTTSIGRPAIAAKLARFGYDAEAAQIFTPGRAAAQYLSSHRLSARLFVQSGALDEFAGVVLDAEPPNAVVIGDLADLWSYERLNEAFRLVHEHGARLIGLGRSPYWRSARGLLLDVGPYLAALEYATRQQALVFGKPERPIFDAVVEDLGLPASQVAMVGDDVRIDVAPAQRAGLRGIVVRTGKFEERDLLQEAAPDLVVGSVAELRGL